MARNVDDLLEYLESLTDRVPLDELVSQLNALDICCDDLRDYVQFSSRGYTRNLVRAGEWYQVLVLCWKNGQRSPIHDHGQSSCGVRVLRGTATETTFEFAPNGLIKATGSRDMAEGSVMATQDQDMHQVSNLQAGDADLVTLHVYSPPLWMMGTYSLTDAKRGTEPMLMDFYDTAGI
jgi:cysteine dioxygenase